MRLRGRRKDFVDPALSGSASRCVRSEARSLRPAGTGALPDGRVIEHVLAQRPARSSERAPRAMNRPSRLARSADRCGGWSERQPARPASRAGEGAARTRRCSSVRSGSSARAPLRRPHRRLERRRKRRVRFPRERRGGRPPPRRVDTHRPDSARKIPGVARSNHRCARRDEPRRHDAGGSDCSRPRRPRERRRARRPGRAPRPRRGSTWSSRFLPQERRSRKSAEQPSSAG